MSFTEETEKFILYYKVIKCLPIYGMVKGFSMHLLFLQVNLKNYNMAGEFNVLICDNKNYRTVNF